MLGDILVFCFGDDEFSSRGDKIYIYMLSEWP
jgi:hypothetical protein